MQILIIKLLEKIYKIEIFFELNFSYAKLKILNTFF